MHESDRTGSKENQDPETTPNEAAALQERLAQANLTPSSSRPPPAHPILKKPRGPSNSGPRPTARFVDVPDSEDETQHQSSDSQRTGSGSGSGSGSGASQSGSQTKKQAPPISKSPAAKADRKPAKKFVASKVTGKRRPVLPRRQSSQSSNGSVNSDTSSRDGKSSTPSQSSHQEFLASPADEAPPEVQGSFRLPTHNEEPVPSVRTLGKLPAKGASPDKPVIVRTSPQPDSRSGSRTRPAAQKRTSSPLIQGYTVQDNTTTSAPRNSPKQPPPPRSTKSLGKQPEVVTRGRTGNPLGIFTAPAPTATVQTTHATTDESTEPNPFEGHWEEEEKAYPKSAIEAPTSTFNTPDPTARTARSRSSESKKRLSAAEPVPSSFFKSPSVVGMSKLAVKGGFDFETPRPTRGDGDDDNVPPLGMLDPDIPKASVLDSKFSPTQPGAAPELPMARSKSQLTLLLELDKERSARNSRTLSGSWGKGDGRSGGGSGKKPGRGGGQAEQN